ncbi:uncharacterized protein BP5553_08965 [Venustampulla echinocandica]|uniref:Uncharacterized protein n=1 Tax=Venustampulla echinocandica TaxID=2656787 RepID=A0A370TDG7_9HELO|nr:uncharacterized protein BP5553_08965 [Venustampulla echinocandica]RDL32509.1 hypothetical protein BP5553_08965 [Venustampulla echinocandica]
MSNLPAGFFITSLNGQRCTAIPKALGAANSDAAAAAAAVAAVTATSQMQQLAQVTASSSQVQTTLPDVPLSSVAPPSSIEIASTTQPTSTSIPAITPAPPIINTSTPEAQASPSPISSAASPASKGTTPTRSSSTPLANTLKSEVRASPTPSSVPNGSENALQSLQSLAMSIPSAAATPTPASLSTESATGDDISLNPRLTAAPVVGGVLGAAAAIAGLAFLFWFLRKRRKAGRQSLLTPLSTGRDSAFYPRDDNEVGSSSYNEKWRSGVGSQGNPFGAAASKLKLGVAGVGASLKSKLVKNDTPSVNLNRGNSQFLDGPISQHSRNNSVLSGSGGNLTVKDRLDTLLDRFREKFSFNQRVRKANEPSDPFEAARGMTEKQARLNNPQPDFSQLLGMDDRELQLQAERSRAALAKTQSGASLPPLGSLGLNFGSNDPFADPIKATGPNEQNIPWKPSKAATGGRSGDAYDSNSNPFEDPVSQTSNPFADPTSQRRPSISNPNTYVADIRRSRGQSVDTTNRRPSGAYRPQSNMTGAVSRYPSSIAPSRDSYRDTIFSSFSGNARKGKGRSDPFDLERPELWRRNNFNNRTSTRQRGTTMSGGLRDSEMNLYPTPLTTNNLQNQGMQRVQSNATYGSKYSSGAPSLVGWGDPGPDLGPGSTNSSMRGNASSSGGSADFSANGGAGTGGHGRLGLDAQGERARQLADGNVSPISLENGAGNGGLVGKAM